MNSIIRKEVGDGIEVIIDGLPKSVATPAIQAKAVMTLLQHGIPAGLNFSAGIITDINTASLKIHGELYKFKFSIVALRAITALEIYSQAINYIEFQIYNNRVDKTLAKATIKYMEEDLRRKHKKWLEE